MLLKLCSIGRFAHTLGKCDWANTLKQVEGFYILKNLFIPIPLFTTFSKVGSNGKGRLNLATALELCISLFVGLQFFEFTFWVGLSNVFTCKSLTRNCSLFTRDFGAIPHLGLSLSCSGWRRKDPHGRSLCAGSSCAANQMWLGASLEPAAPALGDTRAWAGTWDLSQLPLWKTPSWGWKIWACRALLNQDTAITGEVSFGLPGAGTSVQTVYRLPFPYLYLGEMSWWARRWSTCC